MSASEHIAKIERHIIVIKERCRACFKRITNIMTIILVHFCVFWLNAMLIKTGISSIYSPTELKCHQKVGTKNWCSQVIGDYVDVHEENATTNSMNPRTRPAICMGSSENIQGLIKFRCIETGKKIVRRSYTRLPMPDSMIKQVEQLAKRDSQKWNLF